jgi:hypothetical protein
MVIQVGYQASFRQCGDCIRVTLLCLLVPCQNKQVTKMWKHTLSLHALLNAAVTATLRLLHLVRIAEAECGACGKCPRCAVYDCMRLHAFILCASNNAALTV